MTLDQYGHLFPSIEEALAGQLDELVFLPIEFRTKEAVAARQAPAVTEHNAFA